MASSAPRGLRSDHVVTVGIALFSMVFGAGNLIIPPLLALQAGTATPLAMIGFLIAAIGLPVMGFIAVALAGTARELAGRVHPKFGEFFVAAVYLAIGPCLAIPRTSSTAFEMLVPLLPEGVSLGTARLVFAIGINPEKPILENVLAIRQYTPIGAAIMTILVISIIISLNCAKKLETTSTLSPSFARIMPTKSANTIT